MGSEDIRPKYLATGSGGSPADHEQLDLIRDVLAQSPTWEEPPAGVVEGLLAAISREGHIPASEPEVDSARRPLLVAAVSVAAIALAVFGIMSILDAPIAETVVAMTGTDLAPSASGIASLRPTPSGWYIGLDVSGLPAAPEGSYYEGWVWSDDDHGVSIGTFHLRDGDDAVVLWSGVNVAEYPVIWVTLEDESEGPEASDQLVMTGRAEELAAG
ncbi:MAG: anti-sigma factor [Actinomycetota bacterium]|nr:anti-sigma factor [Actinomycetota bacterium]